MDSSDDSSYEEVDLDRYRKEYESDEHWELRKVRNSENLAILALFTTYIRLSSLF